ncbi:acyl-CoA thioesterase [Litorimonas haliclonae]|uniref:acyl-CoA thioesterase n=1 Tax=Litorimonas haliclonae TaxID=2081977 RepID=UPI0039EF5911
MRAQPNALKDYTHFLDIPTRWSDNDVYGHINNAVYYLYFDTVVNEYLIQKGLLDIETSDIIGLVVKTNCDYFAPAAFPDIIKAGLRVANLGNSSVTYEIGLFRNDEEEACAQGQFTHVYVDKRFRRPVELSDKMRAALEILKK